MVASDNYDFTIFEMLRLLLPDINFLRGDALELVVEINGKKYVGYSWSSIRKNGPQIKLEK